MPKKTTVIHTNPALWERCKKEAVEKMGKFSARAMQHAVTLYKKKGGGYRGQKSNVVNEWDKKQRKV